jgi:hypothetical protein
MSFTPPRLSAFSAHPKRKNQSADDADEKPKENNLRKSVQSADKKSFA